MGPSYNPRYEFCKKEDREVAKRAADDGFERRSMHLVIFSRRFREKTTVFKPASFRHDENIDFKTSSIIVKLYAEIN